MGQGASAPPAWRPFAAPCAAQRFHCLGRMHPLIVTVPAGVTDGLYADETLRRFAAEERIVVEFESFRGLANHLDDVFHRLLPRLPDLRELALAPAGGEYAPGADRALSLDWTTPRFGGPASYFSEYGWRSAGAGTALRRLQLAVPLPTALVAALAGQLAAAAPGLEVLELAEVVAPLPPGAVVDETVPPLRRLGHLRYTCVRRGADPSALPLLTAVAATPALRDLDLRLAGDAPADAFAPVPRRPLRRLALVLRPDAAAGRDGFGCLAAGARPCAAIESVTVDARALAPLETLIDPDNPAHPWLDGTGLRAAVHYAQLRMRAACEETLDPAAYAAYDRRRRPDAAPPRHHPYARPTAAPDRPARAADRTLYVRFRDQTLRVAPDGHAPVDAGEGDLVW